MKDEIAGSTLAEEFVHEFMILLKWESSCLRLGRKRQYLQLRKQQGKKEAGDEYIHMAAVQRSILTTHYPDKLGAGSDGLPEYYSGTPI